MEIPIIFELAIIGISRVERRRKGGLQYEYVPFVTLNSQNEEVIQMLHEMFPSSYRYADSRGSTTIHIFEIKGKGRVKAFLSEVLPYIETQRDRWEALWDFVSTYRTTPDEAEYYRSLVNKEV